MCQTHLVFMGAQRGHSRVTEQATVCGLRHDRRGLMDYTSMCARKTASMSRYTGYKPDNEALEKFMSMSADHLRMMWTGRLRQ